VTFTASKQRNSSGEAKENEKPRLVATYSLLVGGIRRNIGHTFVGAGDQSAQSHQSKQGASE